MLILKHKMPLRKLQEESTRLHQEQRDIYGYRSSPIGETGDMLASIKGYKNGVIVLDGDKYRRETGSDRIAMQMDVARAFHSIESGLASPKGLNTKPINPANSTASDNTAEAILENPAEPISSKNTYRIGNNITKETKMLFINDGTPGGTSAVGQTIQSDVRGTLIGERNFMTGESSIRAMYPNGQVFNEIRFTPMETIKQIGNGSTPLIETPKYPVVPYNPNVAALSTTNYFNATLNQSATLTPKYPITVYNPGFAAVQESDYLNAVRVINKDGSSNIPKGTGLATIDNRPYIKDGKPNGRPSYRKEFEYDLYTDYLQRNNITKPADAIVRDEITGEVINWLPGQPRKGVVDFGHSQKSKYSNIFQNYLNERMTPKEFRDWYNDPKNYRFETPNTNRSHAYENIATPLLPQFNSPAIPILEYKLDYINNIQNIIQKQQMKIPIK